jgi:hypothetical protein
MPNPKINGTLLPVAKAPDIAWDPARGQIISQRWESAGDGLAGIASGYAAARIQYNWTKSPHRSVLVANASSSQLGFPEVSCDTWQILANETQKDVREFPGFQAMEASYPGTIGYVVRDVDLYNAGSAPGTPAPDGGAAPQSGYLFELLMRGATHFALGQYVLRHTTNVSNLYGANIADVNVEQCYTTAQLLAEVQNSSLWFFPMPGRLAYKLQNIPTPTAQTHYQWGWRKLPSPETTTANNRVEITTEYWLEQWHIYLYPPVT